MFPITKSVKECRKLADDSMTQEIFCAYRC